ncbi:hypothetical protein [Bacteroides uniformis]|uniref:hypothetical protein n=1 Tax=Bacteroides uniformis TaxID=820 RepID=UPI003CC5C74D
MEAEGESACADSGSTKCRGRLWGPGLEQQYRLWDFTPSSIPQSGGQNGGWGLQWNAALPGWGCNFTSNVTACLS